MFHGATPDTLALACAAILTVMLKRMSRTKALVLMGNAADAIEKELNGGSATAPEAVKLIRGEWLKAI